MLPDLFLGTMGFILGALGVGAKVAAGVSAAVTVASSALSAWATYRQGKANEQVVMMNADLANQEARQQLLIANIQQRLAEQSANAQYAAEMAEAQAARVNAQAIDEERRAGEARSREEIRRARLESERIVAEQKAMFAASGVVGSTGTPLQVMADTVLTLEAEAIDQQYLADVERTKQLFEANVERNRAGRIGAFAGAQRVINLNAAKVEGLAMQVGARNRMSQADIDRNAGRYLRKQATLAAVAQGVGGVVSAAGSFRQPARTTTVTRSPGGGSGRYVSARPASLA